MELGKVARGVHQRGAGVRLGLAFPRAAQGLDRARQPQTLGCLLLPRRTPIRRFWPHRPTQRRRFGRRLLSAGKVYESAPLCSFLLTATNPLGHPTTSAYNASGLSTSTTDADGRTIDYGYNAIGQVTSEPRKRRREK